jgi:hypothetical protein
MPPKSELGSRKDDIAAIIAARKRLLTAGLPTRAVHVLIRLGLEKPSDIRAAPWLDRGGSPGLRSLMLRSHNCGSKTIAHVEQWLNGSA